MPQVLTKLELHLVTDVLRKRGWAFNREAGIGLRLTKPDKSKPVFKSTRKHPRQLMTPISRAHLKEILTRSHDVKEAVLQIEAISTGAQLAPQFGGPVGSGLDQEVMEKLMSQRIENEVHKLNQRSEAALQEATAKLEKLEKALEEANARAAAPPTPQQNANKRASKKKAKKAPRKQPKGGILDRLKGDDEDMPSDDEKEAGYKAILDAQGK